MTFELVGMLSLWILWVFFSIRFCCSHPWSLSFFQPCIYESTIKANTLIYFGVLMVIIVTLLYGCFDWDKNVTLVETEKKFVSRFFRVFFSYYKYYCQYFISYHGVMRAFLSFSHWAYPYKNTYFMIPMNIKRTQANYGCKKNKQKASSL